MATHYIWFFSKNVKLLIINIPLYSKLVPELASNK